VPDHLLPVKQIFGLLAVSCGYPLRETANSKEALNRRPQKVTKGNVLRRSGIQGDVDICRSYGAHSPL